VIKEGTRGEKKLKKGPGGVPRQEFEKKSGTIARTKVNPEHDQKHVTEGNFEERKKKNITSRPGKLSKIGRLIRKKREWGVQKKGDPCQWPPGKMMIYRSGQRQGWGAETSAHGRTKYGGVQGKDSFQKEHKEGVTRGKQTSSKRTHPKRWLKGITKKPRFHGLRIKGKRGDLNKARPPKDPQHKKMV